METTRAGSNPMRLALFYLLAACGSAPPAPADLSPAAGDGPQAQVDLAQPAPSDASMSGDLQSYAPDLGPAVDFATQPADLRALPDLRPAADLAAPCGAVGQPCCGASCGAGLTCAYATDLCGTARPTSCVSAMNCGGLGLPCCDSVGNPSATGFCAGNKKCVGGSCSACP